MSYILEALKKSEQERGHGESPGVQTIHSSGLQYTRQDKPAWPYVLAVVFTLNVAAIIYFLIPVTEPTETSVAETGNTPAQPVVQSRPPTQANTILVKQIPPQPVAMTDTSYEYVAPPKPRYIAPVKPEPVAPPAVTQRTIPVEPSRSEVVGIQDLPVDIQTAIPEIVFSAHVYSSNPQQRSVVINNNFMEEGDALTANLILDEITNNGVIFEYEGTRFYSSVLSNWSTH